MSETFPIKRNDTSPAIGQQLLYGNGAVVDLTGATVRLHIARRGVSIVDAVASIDDAINGMVSYQWQAADTAVDGLYMQEWQVTFQSGAVETFPNGDSNVVVIGPDL